MSRLVARQYEAFAYPQPIGDIAEEVRKGYYQVGDPALYGPVLWPGGKRSGPLKILVAGCGTVQAAYTAYLSRDDEVVGIDLSEASLAHERLLQDRHGLSNLRLFKGDLLDVEQLREQFDVVLCSGVLHHLADPAAGLAALRDVLVPDGVMVLMLYGQTVRTGVYMLQDAFRRMHIEQTSDGVQQVRRILNELPRGHFAQNYIQAAEELRHDTAIVDTFLHPQDRAYTVPQILQLIDATGLVFQNWVDNHHYWRNSLWGPETAVALSVDPLKPHEHWAAVEMLSQAIGLHMFTARHGAQDLAVVDFDLGEWRRFVPHHAPALSRKSAGIFVRGPYELRCTELEQFVLDGADGKRTIGEIIDVPALENLSLDERDEFARRYFEHLWKLGHVMIAMP